MTSCSTLSCGSMNICAMVEQRFRDTGGRRLHERRPCQVIPYIYWAASVYVYSTSSDIDEARPWCATLQTREFILGPNYEP